MALDSMEKGCQKVRPAFEGILLLTHSQETLKQFLIAVFSDEVSFLPNLIDS
jgi:hypothetical protein